MNEIYFGDEVLFYDGKVIRQYDEAMKILREKGFCVFCGDGFVENGAHGFFCDACGLGL